jgi:large subunit ribosomal protein L35
MTPSGKNACAPESSYGILVWCVALRAHLCVSTGPRLPTKFKTASATRAGEVCVKKLKLKTHKATAKRAYATAGGKYLHLKSARTKYRRKKDPTRNRSLSKPSVMAAGDAHKMKRLLPYS